MKKKKSNKIVNNIKYPYLFLFAFLLFFGVLIYRVFYLATSTVVDGVDLQNLAKSRTTRTDILFAKRGSIFSSDGDVLAQNVSSYKLIAYLDESRTTNKNNPQHVVDKNKTANDLANVLGCDASEILKYLNKENVYQTEFGTIGKNINEITKRKIDELKLPGIDFIESYKRYYPKGTFASYSIGYAKNNEDDLTLIGEMGIEKEYNNELSGEDGYITYQKDLRGYQINGTPTVRKDAVQGKDIHLTINSSIQFFVEQALANQDVNYDWEWFNITIADAKTGAILATETSPTFDPNKRNITNYLDISVAAPYEPGSTMKTFTYMAAMENGVYNGSETYLSGVYKTQDGTEIGDWNRNGWGILTFDKGYAMSSNVAVINMINKHMNASMLREYYRKLGFGSKTGVGLPNESSGSLVFKYETEIYNAGFGQGITTTPMQHIQALTSLTNDGILLKPYIIKKVSDPETGNTFETYDKYEIGRVASSSTVDKMLQLMDDCVNGQGNTGSGYRIDSGELIGKTGTSQISEGGGYLSGKNDIISSFAGVYPKSDPKVIIYAAVKRPTDGSQKPISNAVKEVVYNIENYYGEDNNNTVIDVNEYKVNNYVNRDIKSVEEELKSNNIKYMFLGNGDRIIKQYPLNNSNITSLDTIYLVTSLDNILMPNLVGLSSREALSVLDTLKIKYKVEGDGYVNFQSIPAGTLLNSDMEVSLNLFTKY